MASANEVIHRSGLTIGPSSFGSVVFKPMPKLMERVLDGKATAITLGSTVFVRSGDFDDVVAGRRPALVLHELEHTIQWRAGPVVFLTRYVGEYLRFRLVGASHDAAYRSISYEIDAYNAEKANRTEPL